MPSLVLLCFNETRFFFALQIVKTIEHRMGRYTQVVLDTCAYAGTGNVLKVQEMLHLCAEHLDEKAEHQVCDLSVLFRLLSRASRAIAIETSL